MEKPITSQGIPLDKTNIYETLFVFIDDVLFQFKPTTKETGENKITQDLEISLNEETRLNNTFFAFQNQHEDGNSTTDIGVYLRNNRYRFCWIEAKKLPTPNGKNRDEREYVIVDNKKFKGNGGIQRFKESKHAPELSISIMIGYIQDKDFDYWLLKVNGWITELGNTDTEFRENEYCLNKLVSNKCNRFISTHKRKNETTITLHHYWISL
jgi:hypothetical protein